ncbi:unnamed protein product, partial [Prorocentrum cordatum]
TRRGGRRARCGRGADGPGPAPAARAPWRSGAGARGRPASRAGATPLRPRRPRSDQTRRLRGPRGGRERRPLAVPRELPGLLLLLEGAGLAREGPHRRRGPRGALERGGAAGARARPPGGRHRDPLWGAAPDPNDSTYEGQMLDGKRHGFGTL